MKFQLVNKRSQPPSKGTLSNTKVNGNSDAKYDVNFDLINDGLIQKKLQTLDALPRKKNRHNVANEKEVMFHFASINGSESYKYEGDSSIHRSN